MRILAFDTATAISAVALLKDGVVVFEDHAPAELRHGDTLLPRVQRALQAGRLCAEELDLVAVGLGPGSFTGLRVGLATAKGIALAAGVPLRGVATPAVLARGIAEGAPLVAAVLDAFRSEVYFAVYRVQGGELQEVHGPDHGTPEAAAARIAELAGGAATALCGDGTLKYPEAFAGLGDVIDAHVPLGRHLADEALRAHTAEGPSDAATLEPLYIRDADAKLPNTPLKL